MSDQHIDDTLTEAAREALISEARDFIKLDEERLAKDTFTPTMIFTDANAGPRVVFFPELDGSEETRDKLGWAALLLSAAIEDLRAIRWVTDACSATQGTKTDGTPWGYGEMQKALRENTVDAHLVREMVNFQTVEILDDGEFRVSMVCFNYKRDGDKVDVDWDNPQVLIDGTDGQIQGYYTHAFKQAMKAPKLMHEMRKLIGGGQIEDLGLSDDMQRLHALLAAVKMVMQNTHMNVLIPCRNAEEAEHVKDSFREDAPQFGPHTLTALDQDQVELIGRLEEQFDLDSPER